MAKKNKKILEDAMNDFTKNLHEHVQSKYHENDEFKKLTREYLEIHTQFLNLVNEKAGNIEIEDIKQKLDKKRKEILKYHHENMNPFFEY